MRSPLAHAEEEEMWSFKAVSFLFPLKQEILSITLPTAARTMLSNLGRIQGSTKDLRTHKRAWVGKGMVSQGGGLTALHFAAL